MALLGDVGLQKCGVENGKFGSVRRKVSLRRNGKFVLSFSEEYSGTR